ncbi:MAG: CapA family protein [Paludibacter sp.]|nr:CapA family protein [Paludibacter sp.]
MKKYLSLFASLFLFCNLLHNSDRYSIILPENDTVTLVFAGDIMGHSPQYHAAYNPITKTYSYDICFQLVKKYIESADIAAANLEVPIAGAPYSGFPGFSSPDALLDGLKYAGFDLLLTANNHTLDRNKAGMERTINQIEQRGFYHAGSYIDNIQRDSLYPLIIESKGLKIAFLNCTYGTNKYLPTSPNIVNYIDTTEIKNSIQQADKLGADFKVMAIHWGNEYELREDTTQQRLAQFLVNHGINLIIGSHPHVVQDAEFLYAKDSIPVPVFYSVGNFISNQRKPNTNGGIVACVEIGSKSKTILRTSYLPVYVYKGILNDIYQYHLIPTTDFIDRPSKFPINRTDSIALTYFDRETRLKLKNIKLLHQAI